MMARTKKSEEDLDMQVELIDGVKTIPMKSELINPEPLKTIISVCGQSLYIPFLTPNGPREILLRAKNSVTVPLNWSSNILDTFVNRRLVKVLK